MKCYSRILMSKMASELNGKLVTSKVRTQGEHLVI